MGSILWSLAAQGDLKHLYAFVHEKKPAAAWEAMQAIKRQAGGLGRMAQIGRAMGDKTGRRELYIAFGAGTYVLRYRIDPQGRVVIIRVWHSRENR